MADVINTAAPTFPNPTDAVYRLRYDQVAMYHVETAPARVQMLTPACASLWWSLDPTWAQANSHFEGAISYDPIGKSAGTFHLSSD